MKSPEKDLLISNEPDSSKSVIEPSSLQNHKSDEVDLDDIQVEGLSKPDQLEHEEEEGKIEGNAADYEKVDNSASAD